MNASIPRPEFPRPQMTRGEESWYCLNGTWEFELDLGRSGLEREFQYRDSLSHTITVPFCPESQLSGIAYTDFIPAVWYRRTFVLTTEQRAGRVFLRFGAVDYHCEVWINGVHVGVHEGGYTSFGFEISDSVVTGENTVTVYAADDMRHGNQPMGKQSPEYYAHDCSYTRTTGIWQTVWLEFVPDAYIDSYQIYPSPADSRFIIHVKTGGDPAVHVRVTAAYHGRAVGTATASISLHAASAEVSLSELHLWNPGAPALYDLIIELLDGGGTVCDAVIGYLGMRSVSIEDRAVTINGKPVFQRLILDQGFNPEGIYTYPDEEFFVRDIRLAMDLGFNGARMHQRVFEERFLYWADRLGYLVWGEHALFGMTNTDQLQNFLPEWAEAIARDFNHPALVCWSCFNEAYWAEPLNLKGQEVVWRLTKMLDPTRPVLDASGGHHICTDIFDVHDYEQDAAVLRANLDKMLNGLDDGVTYLHNPAHNRRNAHLNASAVYEGQPYMISEYGGTWWKPEMASDTDGETSWGYGTRPESEAAFAARYAELTKALLESPLVSGFCYTQLTDVEQEQNGLYLYDRTRKFSDETYRMIRETNEIRAAVETK